MVLNHRPLPGGRVPLSPYRRRDPGDDRATAAAVPEDLGGAVVGGAQHRIEQLPVFGRQCRTSQQQVVGDEQLDDRRDGDPPAIAVGHPLPRRAVQHNGGEVGTLCSGFGRGLLGATVKAVEARGGLVGRGFGQGGQRALRGDDDQRRCRGFHRRGAVDPGLTTGHGQHSCGNRDQPRRSPSHAYPSRARDSRKGNGLAECRPPARSSLTGGHWSCVLSPARRFRGPADRRFHCMRPHLAQLSSCLCRTWGRSARPPRDAPDTPESSAWRRVRTASPPQPRTARKSHR